MKHHLTSLCIVLSLISCQKTITTESEVATATVSSDANSPLNCHSIAFASDYPVKPGEVPPFSFTKTLYPDARVKTIRMLSRRNPIHPAFKKEAIETIGNFTYGANTGGDKSTYPGLAMLNGTREVFEYYKTPSGAGARRSVTKRNINLVFKLKSNGYVGEVFDYQLDQVILEVVYQAQHPETITAIGASQYDRTGTKGVQFWFVTPDQYGNIASFYFPFGPTDSYFRVTYDYASPRGTKTYNYIPSQNLVSEDYSLCEVMQWLPQSTHQRKTAGGTFAVNGQWVNQDQVYKNFQFDSKGNQTSATYGDNILQKTTWSCQN